MSITRREKKSNHCEESERKELKWQERKSLIWKGNFEWNNWDSPTFGPGWGEGATPCPGHTGHRVPHDALEDLSCARLPVREIPLSVIRAIMSVLFNKAPALMSMHFWECSKCGPDFKGEKGPSRCILCWCMIFYCVIFICTNSLCL